MLHFRSVSTTPRDTLSALVICSKVPWDDHKLIPESELKRKRKIYHQVHTLIKNRGGIFGGYVLDMIAGKAPRDIDICVNETKWNSVVQILNHEFGKRNVKTSQLTRMLSYGPMVKVMRVKIRVIYDEAFENVFIDMVHNPGSYVFFRANALGINGDGGICARLFKSSFHFMPICFQEIKENKHTLLLNFPKYKTVTKDPTLKRFINDALYRMDCMISKGYDVTSWFYKIYKAVFVECKCADSKAITVKEFVKSFKATETGYPFYMCGRCRCRISLRGDYLYIRSELPDMTNAKLDFVHGEIMYYKLISI